MVLQPDEALPEPMSPWHDLEADLEDYRQATGESLWETLDLDRWTPGFDLLDTYRRLEEEVAQALKEEGDLRARIRRHVFALLQGQGQRLPERGVYEAKIQEIEEVHRRLLFAGKVEACDGITRAYDTLPLTIVQIGVCLVSYQGDQGTWGHRIYRRDLRVRSGDPLEEVVGLLEERRRRGSLDLASPRDRLSALLNRGLMTFAERAVLVQRARAPWRMGHGNPLAYELLTGAGLVDRRDGSYPLMRASLEVLEALVQHRKFVFVPSRAPRHLLTLGNALLPLQYAVLDTLESYLHALVDRGHYRGAEEERVREFADRVGSQVVRGVYRATRWSPPQVFYAHREEVHAAALVALADSVLQEHRGFPSLIDLADQVCKTVFGVEAFVPQVRVAYLEAGEPFGYETERRTR